MSEIHTPVASELAIDPNIEGLFAKLLELGPKPIANFVVIDVESGDPTEEEAAKV